jgi:SlyX protein
MEDITRLEKRVSGLEQRIAHQDVTIQDLSDMTTQQWAIIDALTKKTERLKERLLANEETAETSAPQDPPPPHY